MDENHADVVIPRSESKVRIVGMPTGLPGVLKHVERQGKMLDAIASSLPKLTPIPRISYPRIEDVEPINFTPPANRQLEVAAETRDLIDQLVGVMRDQANTEAMLAVEAKRTRQWAAASFLVAAVGVFITLLH